MITITVVRHGESTDNLRPLWAGWADAPLSNHGMNQAKALGEYMKDTRYDAIVASDLKRARWTAEQIHQNQAEPKPPLTISELLREQHFGVAERKPFGEENGGYTRLSGRSFKFEDGESLDDVRKRANEVILQYIEASLQESQGKPPTSKHIAVVAHGIFNSEFTGALLARRESDRPLEWGYKGMTNTGWTRIELGYADEQFRTSTPSSTAAISTDPAETVNPSSRPTDPPPQTPIDNSLPPLSVRIVATDVTKHLEGIHRQKGGIGSSGFDEKQKDLRAFFSGAKSD